MEILDFTTQINTLNDESIRHINNLNLASYTNIRMYMADLFKKEKRLEDALKIYLEVCYLDLNGSNNRGGTSPELLKEFPVFDPSIGFLAPAIILYIRKISKKLNISIEDLKKMFFEINSNLEDYVKLPISKDNAWIKIKKELLNVKNS